LRKERWLREKKILFIYMPKRARKEQLAPDERFRELYVYLNCCPCCAAYSVKSTYAQQIKDVIAQPHTIDIWRTCSVAHRSAAAAAAGDTCRDDDSEMLASEAFGPFFRCHGNTNCNQIDVFFVVEGTRRDLELLETWRRATHSITEHDMSLYTWSEVRGIHTPPIPHPSKKYPVEFHRPAFTPHAAGIAFADMKAKRAKRNVRPQSLYSKHELLFAEMSIMLTGSSRAGLAAIRFVDSMLSQYRGVGGDGGGVADDHSAPGCIRVVQ